MTDRSPLAQLDHLDVPRLRRLLVEQLFRRKLKLTWAADFFDRSDRADSKYK